MTLPTIGPSGNGIMLGWTMGKIANSLDRAAALENDLRVTRARLLKAEAEAEGVHALQDAVICELQALATGAQKVRALSDPRNREDRARLFENAMEDALRRNGGGRLQRTTRR